MSGLSYSSICPNCGQSCNAYTDYKPFDYTDITCIHCGFYSTVLTGQLELGELNTMREDEGLEPLSELPEQKETF